MNGTNGSAPNGVYFWRSLAIGSTALLIGLGTWIYTADRTAGADALQRVEASINVKLNQFADEARRDHDLLLSLGERHDALRVRVDEHGQRLAAVERVVRP